jgi:mono/diheme cytochrome c family protein
MKRILLPCIALGTSLFLSILGTARAAMAAQDEGSTRALAIHAQEVFKGYCQKCHNERDQKGDLIVSDRGSLLDKDRLPTPALVPGDPDKSLLLQRIQDKARPMPPKKENNPVSPRDIALLRAWIVAGAPAPATSVVASASQADPAGPVQSRVKAIFREHCGSCHDTAKPEAGLHIFNREEIVNSKVIVPGKPEESVLLDRLTSADPRRLMPQGGPKLRAEQIEAIRRWIAEQAPPFDKDLPFTPEQVGSAYVLEKILDDVRLLKKQGKDVSKYRYFSLNHLLAAGISAEGLEQHARALALAINHLSWEPDLVHPFAIDANRTVFRVDIDGLGWYERPFVQFDGNKETTQRSKVNLFDLLLLEYPYGTVYNQGSSVHLFEQLVPEFLTPAEQVRPIPFIRADWFVATALRPPLYEDMLKLPRQLSDLEAFLGVDSARDVDNRRVMRAGMTVSGVSRNNRVVERHRSRVGKGGYYWKSFDYRSSRGLDNIFRDPVGLSSIAGGEMLWSLPNGLQAYYVANAKGKRIEEAPTSIVTDDFSSDQIVRNGLSCIRCHATGINTFQDNVRFALDRLGGSVPFDVQAARDLYPTREKMHEQVQEDTRSFAGALQELFADGQVSGAVLTPVTRRYLDEAVTGKTAVAEVGLRNGESILPQFGTEEGILLGLAQLSNKGRVRRDTWEEVQPRVVRLLAQGLPMVALDGTTHQDHLPREPVPATLEVNQKRFISGENAELVVKNTSKAESIFFELIFTKPSGLKEFITQGQVELAAGQEKRFKSKDVEPGSGRYQVTLFAARTAFPKGELIALPEKTQRGIGIADRVIHPFYKLTERGLKFEFDPRGVKKQTIEIVTE